MSVAWPFWCDATLFGGCRSAAPGPRPTASPGARAIQASARPFTMLAGDRPAEPVLAEGGP
ncbi:MAG TPA: hypothetical protein VMH78_00505 [Thermoplasmata archaeon]|nr:hypothetical protein [Thermoplasmata archaeon]